MRHLRTLAAAAGLAAAAAVLAVPASTLAAARSPVVFAFKGSQGYTDAVRKPGTFAIEGGQIEGKDGHWKQWGATAKTSRIKIDDNNSGAWETGAVRLYDVRRHNGKRYYAMGQVTESKSGGGKLIYCIRFTKNNGSTVPEWNPAPGNAEAGCTGS